MFYFQLREDEKANIAFNESKFRFNFNKYNFE